MGLTNIHHASQVLYHAGSDRPVQAVIADLQKGVLLVGRGFAQEELHDFEDCLHFPARDRWVRNNGRDALSVAEADASVPIPTLYTSPGLGERRRMGPIGESDNNEQPIDVAYIMVVRGRSGALYSKVRVLYSLSAIAAAILEEALNGYFVVFSAAMLKQDVARLPDKNLTFVKVEKLSDLLVTAEKEGDSSIPLCC